MDEQFEADMGLINIFSFKFPSNARYQEVPKSSIV